ncbi:XRE family transcriptional regulator [Enterobacterales bacterium]|nr:XRE family transcriptional regulator [Enterobacterales bacterium]
MTSKQSSNTTHVTEAKDNIFIDLGFPPEQAAVLLAESDKDIALALALKEQLMAEISDWIEVKSLRQTDAAQILHVSRPRISDVVNKKTEKFTLDSLIGMVSLIGKRVTLIIE